MRILILGAGAIGGYYGAHLAEAGADVTFLVRPRRAGQLARDGLVVQTGGREIRQPVNTVLAGQIDRPFDLVVVACKAYDLPGAIDAIAPAVGEDTGVLPVLNGIAHFDVLDARFGPHRVLGGVCYIATTLAANGHIRHLSPLDTFLFGDRTGRPSRHIDALAALFAKTAVAAKPSPDIVQDLWEKWAMLAAGAALTCLMRGTVGDIVATDDGRSISEAMVEECRAIAAASGHDPRPASFDRTRGMLTAPKSVWAASMMRDIEQNAPRLESDHIIGDLLRRGRIAGIAAPLLGAAYCHLQVYDARHTTDSEKPEVPHAGT
jgi:2-dehydropantoate 2-reductase